MRPAVLLVGYFFDTDLELSFFTLREVSSATLHLLFTTEDRAVLSASHDVQPAHVLVGCVVRYI